MNNILMEPYPINYPLINGSLLNRHSDGWFIIQVILDSDSRRVFGSGSDPNFSGQKIFPFWFQFGKKMWN